MVVAKRKSPWRMLGESRLKFENEGQWTTRRDSDQEAHVEKHHDHALPLTLLRPFSHARSLTTQIAVRFWGWTENKREEEKDFAELSQRAKEGKALYGESDQPEWVQGSAFRNSVWTQLKFSAY